MKLDLKNYKNRHSFMSKIARVIWNVVWLLFFRTTPRLTLFRPWRIALLKLFGAKVAWSSDVLPSCKIWQPWRLTMGEFACLGENVDCYSVAPIVLGDQVTVSQGVRLCTAGHDISSPIMELTYKPIVVGANAWVAAWSIVMPGMRWIWHFQRQHRSRMMNAAKWAHEVKNLSKRNIPGMLSVMR